MSLPFLTQKSRRKYGSKESMGSNSAIQMPNVFVVPPEEDETPAWCFFDAENPALSQVVERPETPDINLLAFQSDMNAPAYYNHLDDMDATIVPGENISVVDALMADGDQGDEYIDSDMESDYGGDEAPEDDSHSIRESNRYQPRNMRNAADDSDVIEVVKVSRRSVVPESFDNGESTKMRSEMKRTVTLKSRASKVFRSLKGTLRSSKPRAQDIFPPPPLPISTTASISPVQQPEVSDRSKTPTVKRRGSRTLSQLFTAPSLKSQTSVASFDDRPPMSATDSASVTSHPQSFSGSTKPMSRRSSIYNAAEQDEARLKAASPTPTVSSSKSATRRFSMLTLQKLFSHSSQSSEPATTPIIPDDSGRTTPTPRSTTSTPPSLMSSVLTSGPQTPTSAEEVNAVRLISRKDTADAPVFDSLESVFDTNDDLNLGLGLGLNLDPESNPNLDKIPRKSRSNSLRQSWEAVTPRLFAKGPRTSQGPDIIEEGDVSFEMRLDSLHFDGLSFDADQFTAK